MMRRYALLTLTLTLMNLSCSAHKIRIMPVYKDINGRWHLLLKNHDNRFWTDFSTDIDSEIVPDEKARQAVQEQTDGLYTTDTINMLTAPVLVGDNEEDQDILYFAPVSYKEPREHLCWIPINLILNNEPTKSIPLKEDLQKILATSWATAEKIIEDAQPELAQTSYADQVAADEPATPARRISILPAVDRAIAPLNEAFAQELAPSSSFSSLHDQTTAGEPSSEGPAVSRSASLLPDQKMAGELPVDREAVSNTARSGQQSRCTRIAYFYKT